MSHKYTGIQVVPKLPELKASNKVFCDTTDKITDERGGRAIYRESAKV